MKLRKVLPLRGPNIWARFPVLEAWLEVSQLPALSAARLAAIDAWLRERLRAYALVGAAGEGPDVTAAVAADAPLDLPALLARTVLALQIQQGQALRFWASGTGGETGVQIACQYECEAQAKAALEGALALIARLAAEGESMLEPDLEPIIAAVRDAGPESVAPPTLRLLVDAARARQIPVREIEPGLVQLGHGHRQRRIAAHALDATSQLAAELCQRPELLRTLFRSVGIPAEGEQPARGEFHRLLVVGGQLIAAVRSVVDLDSAREEASENGRWIDVTDNVHSEVVQRAIEAAAVVGLSIALVDVVAIDIGRPLERQAGAVVNVHADPDLTIFRTPRSNVSRAVAEPILDLLFPGSATGRVPLVTVTGVNGKTTTVRFIAHILAVPGRKVGMTCTEGIYIGNRRIDTGDCSGPKSARNVLLHPLVEAAVLESARGGILREGLGFDRADVAVVTNIAEGDHLGIGGIDTLDQLARVKRVIVENVGSSGVAVLKADDPLTAAMAPHCPGSVVFIARDGEHPVIVAHRAAGGRAVFVRDRSIVLADGATEIPFLALDRVPLTHGGRVGFQVENALAATAATWSLGVPAEVIRTGLETFSAGVDKLPGRFNLMEVGGAAVVIDYGHNTSSLHAMIEALRQFPHERRTCIYTAAGDRRNEDMVRQGELLGDAFDRVILYEDQYIRGRAPGEIASIFRRGLAVGQRVKQVEEHLGWARALEATLATLQPGELLLVQADEVDVTMAFVEQHLAASRELSLRDVLAGTPPAAAPADESKLMNAKRE